MGKKSRLKMLGSDKEGRIHQAKEHERQKREEEKKIIDRWLTAKAEEIQQAKEQRRSLPSPNLDKIRLAEINRRFQKTRRVVKKE